MPVSGTMTLNTKVYSPRGTSDGISTWALVGDSTFGGATSLLTESVRGPLSDGKYRTRWVLTIPKAASTDSSCACTGQTLGTAKVDITIDIPSVLTAAERQDFVDRIQSLVALSVFDVSVATPEGSW